MDPERAFGWHCRILGGFLVVAAIFTPLSVLFIGAVVFALCASAALFGYYIPISTAARLPWRRSRDGVALRRWIVAGVAAPLVVAIALEATEHVPLGVGAHELAVKLVCVLGVALAVIVVSGAIDWYVILPRLAGYLGAPPCQSSFARRWKWVTIGWYLHRIIAALATIGGPVAAAIIVSIYLLGHVDEFVAGEAIAIAGLVAAAYKFRIPTAAMLMLNPQVQVGDAVQYATFFTREPMPGYVVDVSLESVKVRDTPHGGDGGEEATETLVAQARSEDSVAARAARIALARRFGERKDAVAIPINRIEDYLRREPRRFEGCGAGCSGVNWYCKNNPQAS